MSKLVQFRIKHSSVWKDFKTCVAKLPSHKLGSIGGEAEEALVLWIKEYGTEDLKKLYSKHDELKKTSVTKDDIFFSSENPIDEKPNVGNYHYQALYDFLLESEPGTPVFFTLIEQFVSKRGKSGNATYKRYADRMVKVGILEPVGDDYDKYKILDVSHPGKAMDLQESSEFQDH
jgi:hypothetical protein